MIYVDANFWIYWFDQRLPEHKHVLRHMRQVIQEGVILNVVTLMEVAHYFRNLAAEEFREKLDTIQSLTTLKVVSLDLDLAKSAFDKLAKYAKIGVGSRDSVIIATMESVGTKRIATHDRVFTRIKGLEVIDPIPANLA
ncbi:MAG: type II toxin-antitoxin system VapC family toxin [Candidatus Atabeyarchaeum deiterrae]